MLKGGRQSGVQTGASKEVEEGGVWMRRKLHTVDLVRRA